MPLSAKVRAHSLQPGAAPHPCFYCLGLCFPHRRQMCTEVVGGWDRAGILLIMVFSRINLPG